MHPTGTTTETSRQAAGQRVTIDYVGVNGTDGKAFDNTWSSHRIWPTAPGAPGNSRHARQPGPRRRRRRSRWRKPVMPSTANRPSPTGAAVR